MKGLFVFVDERDYLEFKKKLLEEGKTISRWVREKIKEYIHSDTETHGGQKTHSQARATRV